MLSQKMSWSSPWDFLAAFYNRSNILRYEDIDTMIARTFARRQNCILLGWLINEVQHFMMHSFHTVDRDRTIFAHRSIKNIRAKIGGKQKECEVPIVRTKLIVRTSIVRTISYCPVVVAPHKIRIDTSRSVRDFSSDAAPVRWFVFDPLFCLFSTSRA